MPAYARKPERTRTLTPDQLEDLLCRAEDANLIDGWRCRGKTYEIRVPVGSFRLEPNAAGVFASKLFETTENHLATRKG